MENEMKATYHAGGTHLVYGMGPPASWAEYHFHLGTLSKKKNNIIWEFFPTWGGGVFPNPKTFVNLPSIFLYAKFILRC